MGQQPEPMSLEALADLLVDLAERVRTGDSLEGHLEWLLPGPDDPGAPDDVLVRAGFRVGNRMGQGSFRMIGPYVDDKPPAPEAGGAVQCRCEQLGPFTPVEDPTEHHPLCPLPMPRTLVYAANDAHAEAIRATYPDADVRIWSGDWVNPAPASMTDPSWTDAGHCRRCGVRLWRLGDILVALTVPGSNLCADGGPHHPRTDAGPGQGGFATIGPLVPDVEPGPAPPVYVASENIAMALRTRYPGITVRVTGVNMSSIDWAAVQGGEVPW